MSPREVEISQKQLRPMLMMKFQTHIADIARTEEYLELTINILIYGFECFFFKRISE